MKADFKRPEPFQAPVTTIHVVEPGVRSGASALRCKIGENVKFTTVSLESYFFAKWAPDAWDALLVAAAVEFADHTKHRPAYTWRRHFALRIPVHHPRLWNSPKVENALRDALEFLTGDEWEFEFVARKKDVPRPAQPQLSLNPQVEAVIPFSDGMDSCTVAALLERRMGDTLVRIRLGTGLDDGKELSRQRKAFTRIPYKISQGEKPFVESSARSRGFKFAIISGIAAYLSNANKIIVPESGQGALGPSLVTVGQASEDCRSHPLFTRRMEAFLKALLGCDISYQFPQIWSTKAETLLQFVDECKDSSWEKTSSCWQQNRQSSVDGNWRHCGICAACMLRRLSVYAAGLKEAKETYVWETLSAKTFKAGAVAGFKDSKITPAMRQYAIAGALHLDHLAGLLDSPANAPKLDLTSFQLGECFGITEEQARNKLNRLLQQHSREWKDFMDSLGKNSFIHEWALGARS
jgi:7-cyano-7-deazaguanine synthase in queuosine biosynthesis